MPERMQVLLLMGPVVPPPAPKAVIDALTGVQVTTSAGQASGFQLTFAVSKRSPIQQTLLPAGFFDPQIRVILTVVVNGTPSVLSDGLITRLELVPSDNPGESTLTVTGEDLTLAMNLVEEPACYPALSREARVAVICAKYAQYGIVPLPVPAALADVPNPTKEIPAQSGTDLDYVRDLAEGVGYVFYIDPGPLPGANIAYWGPEIRAGLLQPALSVNMDAATNVESMTFSADGLAPKQLTLTVTEPRTRLSVPVPVPDIGLLRPPLSARPLVPLRRGPVPNTSKLTPLRAALYGIGQAVHVADAVSGQGSLDVLRYGHVLRARRLVGVRGAGLAYDGFYFVRSVTHNIKPGEYKQSFQLTRDGLISQTPVVMT